MTMDRVYNSHGFQQQQQPAHPSLPAQSLQQQHLYRHEHQFVLPHPHHISQSGNNLATNGAQMPILHRPVHPPPPPPSNVLSNNTQLITTTSIHQPETRCSNLNSPTNISPDSMHATTTLNSRPVDTNAHNHPPSNHHHHHQHHHHQQQQQQQQHYNHTHYNHYQSASNVQAHHQHYLEQQYLSHSVNVPPPRQQQYHNQQTVVDSSSVENYNVVQDHFIEEVIQAILEAKEALEKPIEERDEHDILLIDHLCSLVHGFDAFPRSVRRALAAQAVLIVIDEKGKELIVNNEELDSFCVLIFGECEQLNVAKTVPIRLYKVGDSFGVCEPTTETIRFVGHMVTRCENCAFLCVKRDDFYTILTDPANYPSKETIRHRDRNGNIVCISQFNEDKKSSGPLWSYKMQSTNPYKIALPDGHVITKATEECLLLALVDGYDKIDQDYVDDYLLLFRVFMTYDMKDKDKKLPPGMIKLCLALLQWLDHYNYRDKVVKIVLAWLSSYYHDFELNSNFTYLFFKDLESKLMHLNMNNQLHLLHVTLSTKSKTRHVTISRSSREHKLPFSISGGYEKNCGIFVTHVHGSICDECPNLVSYLKFPNMSLESIRHPIIPPRNRIHNNLLQDLKTSASLRPGDQILEVNGTNFAAIKLEEAKKKLDMFTHLSLTVRYNPSAFHEMQAVPEGRRKSSLSSISSVSPYQPSSNQTKFTFNPQDQLCNKLNDQYPPPSPLFSSNANFGFRSIIKSAPKTDKSRISSLINHSKQFVKQIRDSTVQSSFNNMETMSKTSDNTSDDQSNDVDITKAKSNTDLSSVRGKDKALEAGLSSVVRSEDMNPSSITENALNGNNQTLVNVLRVFNAANNEFRYLLVHEETTAREVVMVAVKEFNLSVNPGSNVTPADKSVSSLNWHLYEVSVVPESKTIKQKCLSEQTSRLAERASLCSRFYIKNNSQSSFGPSRLDMGDDVLVSEMLKESPTSITLTSLNATLLAVELTLVDFDKFRSIEPQQFVYDSFFDYSEKSEQKLNGSSVADSASLKSSNSDGTEDQLQAINKSRTIPKSWMQEYQEFADISNKEMFWVVCEILSEQNISRRVKIVKQFVRVADVCSQLRNYNSMFAIISGLGHSCVSRLRRTFDKLKPKYKNQLEKMRCLFDPSKNMSNYRSCLGQTQPPAIPLFPQIKKDLTFTKEGRSIYIRESNEPSEDEDLGGCYSQDTIKRRTRGELITVKSAAMSEGSQYHLPIAQTRSVSYTSINNNNNNGRAAGANSDSMLVNFAELRQFTERVRNVIYYSSVPYSNDLLTNTKDGLRNQAQIKKMHQEWQMRKRIRHYIDQTLNSAIIDSGKSSEKADQTDAPAKSSTNGGKLDINYDERVLYQRSLDIEPEINTRPQVTSVASSTDRYPSQTAAMQIEVLPNQAQATPIALNMQPPLSLANSSPTLSKSSSLSSCSSFNHHLPNYHAPRGGNISSVGKFGTESTESLRKLQALSENVDDWRPYHGANSNAGNSSSNLIRASGDQTRSKSLVPSRIFPPKNGR